MEHQHRTMIEAVENHMPEALVRMCCLARLKLFSGLRFSEMQSYLACFLLHCSVVLQMHAAELAA